MSEPVALVTDDRDPYAVEWGRLIRSKRRSGMFPPDAETKLDDGSTRQVDFADYLGVTQTTVSMWETGEQVPSSRHQQVLVKRLGVTPDELWRLHHADRGAA